MRQFLDYLLAHDAGAPPLPKAEVYRSMVRAGLLDAVKDTLPVTRSVLGDEGFAALVARFLAAGGPKTPLFHAIPGDLVAFAISADEPFADLMHYEWIDLLAARHPFDLDRRAPANDGKLHVNPTMTCGVYARPVHTISAENPSPEAFRTPSAYLVWRRPISDKVVFHRAGLLIARGIEILSETPLAIEELARRLKDEAEGLDVTAICAALDEALGDLRERDGILP